MNGIPNTIPYDRPTLLQTSVKQAKVNEKRALIFLEDKAANDSIENNT